MNTPTPPTELVERLAKEESAHIETIKQRDRAEEAADNLAYEIAPVEVIGEHSNLNNPWSEALDYLSSGKREEDARAAERKRCAGKVNDLRVEIMAAVDLGVKKTGKLSTSEQDVFDATTGMLTQLETNLRALPPGEGR